MLRDQYNRQLKTIRNRKRAAIKRGDHDALAALTTKEMDMVALRDRLSHHTVAESPVIDHNSIVARRTARTTGAESRVIKTTAQTHERARTIQSVTADSHTTEVEVKTVGGTTTTTRDIKTTTKTKSATEAVRQEFRSKHEEIVRMYHTASLEEIVTCIDFLSSAVGSHWSQQLPNIDGILATTADIGCDLRQFVRRVVALPHDNMAKIVMMWVDAYDQQRHNAGYEHAMLSPTIAAKYVSSFLSSTRSTENSYHALYDVIMTPGMAAIIWSNHTMTDIANVLQHGHFDRLKSVQEFPTKERGLMGGIGYLTTVWLLGGRKRDVIGGDHAPGSKPISSSSSSSLDKSVSSKHAKVMVTLADGSTRRLCELSPKQQADVRRGLGVDGTHFIRRNKNRSSGTVQHKIIHVHGVAPEHINNSEVHELRSRSAVYEYMYTCTSPVLDDDYHVFEVDLSFWTSDYKQIRFEAVPIVPASARVIAIYDRLAAASATTQELHQEQMKALKETSFDKEVKKMMSSYRHSDRSVASHVGLHVNHDGSACGYDADDLSTDLNGFRRAMHAKLLQEKQEQMYRKFYK